MAERPDDSSLSSASETDSVITPVITPVLESVSIITKKLYEGEANFKERIAQELTQLSYKGCEDGFINAIHVFHQTVNILFAERVDLTTRPLQDIELGLQRLLCHSLDNRVTNREIGTYLVFPDTISGIRLKCPTDFLKYDILNHYAIPTFVQKLIECQLQLKWDTPIGLPEKFSYYDFCEAEKIHWKSTKLSLNWIRNAHVKVQLYRHCMSHTPNNDIQAADLCPTVYVKTGEGQWKSLKKDLECFKDGDIEVEDFNWISEPIKEYILDEAEIIPTEAAELKACLTKRTLYWAVVNDSNFKTDVNSPFHPIGKTQVYVGKASKGIKDRWLSQSSSHCCHMKKGLSSLRELKTYDADKVKDVQLVDAVLLLEKLKGNPNSALFLMKTFGNEKTLTDAESKNIDGKKLSNKNLHIVPSCQLDWQPKFMAYGMNVISGKAKTS